MSKKIIVVSNTSWYLFNFRLNLMLHLQNRGYVIIAVAPLDNYSSRFAAHGIQFKAIPMDNKGTHPVKDGLLILRFIKLFFTIKPLCILSYTPKCNIYGALAAGFLNIPIINNVSGLGTAFIKENLVTRIVKWLYVVSLKKSAKVFFQNNDDLTLFVENGLVNPSLTGLLPGSGVDINRFTPMPFTPRSTFVFLLVARMLKDKGVVEFVTAARDLKIKYPHIDYQLLGFLDVKNPTAVSSMEMNTWVSEGIVSYLGVSDSVVDFLRLADCVVLPSYYREGVPRSLLEAASVGKPIITTDAVGCREVVDDGFNGFLCEPRRSAEDLKAKMEKMLLLPEAERLQMGLNSREKAVRQFDEKIVIDRYVEVIQSLDKTQPYF